MASKISNELELLRMKGLAKKQKANISTKDGGGDAFLTPEEAKAFLAGQKEAAKKGVIQPTPPAGLSGGELDGWYTQQRQRDLDAKKNRDEAESILRGYRMSHQPRGGRPSGSDSETSRAPFGSCAIDSIPSAIHSRNIFQELEKKHNGPPGGRWGEGEGKKLDENATWNFIQKGGKYSPEINRYHIYLSKACPWSHRVLMVRALKGLEGVLSMTVVHPIWQSTQPDGSGDDHRGWVFAKSRTRGGGVSNSDGLGGPFPNCYEGNQPDPIHGAASIRELYEKSGNADGNYKVPILWDKQTGTIVSKESWQIMRILNVAFNEFAKNPGLDLYPEGDRSKIDAVCDWMYPTLNNGVYRCGFAMTQKAYDDSLDDLAVAFDQVEGHLRKHRYLCGPALTEADLRLFVTLIRFDEVYSIYFKCNVRSVADSPTLLGYCQDLYQMVGIRETIDMQQIKAHYYCSHPDLNRYSIIPRGRGFLKLLEEHHNRSDLP